MDDAERKPILSPKGHESDDHDARLAMTASMDSTEGESDVGFKLSGSATSAASLLGRYELVCRVGCGGFGEVWKAYDPQLQRHIALKMPRTDREFPPALHAQFLAEGRKLARVAECDGVVTVYDAGESNGVAYIVSEFIEAGSLKDRVLKEALSTEESVALVVEIAGALHSAHLKGLVHRDIKPGNILLKDNGKPVIADFGLAATERDQLGEPHFTVGTYAYISPEQLTSGSRLANPQADIYSLGVVLYQLLTGRLPFVSDSVRDYKHQVVHRPPRPPRTVNDKIPPELERVILKCLAKEPTDRYTTAADMAHDLIATSEVRSADPLPEVKTGSAKPRGFRWEWIIVGSLLVAVAALLTGWAQGWFQGQPRKEDSAAIPGALRKSRNEPRKPAKNPRAFQDWTNEELVTEQPYRLLLHEPTTLMGGGGHFKVNLERLHVSANQLGMFQFGSLKRSSYTLRVDIRQRRRDWEGKVGIFFGVRMAEHKRGTKIRRPSGQMILIGPNSDRADRKRFPLMAARYRIGKGPLPLYPTTAVNYKQKLAGTEEGRPVTLEVTVSKGWLTSIRWGNVNLRILRNGDLNNCFDSKDYLGAFGVVAANADADFQNATIRLANE